MGSFPFFIGKPAPGVPLWVAYTAASMFVAAGIAMVCQSLGSPDRAKTAWGFMLVAFLTVFNWTAFGPGERMGKVSVGIGSASASQSKTDVRIPFIIATSIMDLIALICIVNAIKKKFTGLDPKPPKRE